MCRKLLPAFKIFFSVLNVLFSYREGTSGRIRVNATPLSRIILFCVKRLSHSDFLPYYYMECSRTQFALIFLAGLCLFLFNICLLLLTIRSMGAAAELILLTSILLVLGIY